jgi:hypothetical protein
MGEQHFLFDISQSEKTLLKPDIELGTVRKSGGYTKTEPRAWTESEMEWMLDQKQQGMSVEEIASALGRSNVSVQIKLKRISKKVDTYNDRNRDIKYSANLDFYNLLQPKSIADVYAADSYWKKLCNNTVTNDKDERFNADYTDDALDFMCRMKLEGKKFDLIDLDPYGSAYDCIDLAMKMSKKGVIISFGEIGHRRWKRTAFVESRYGITSVEDDWVRKFIEETQRIAATNKKIAEPQRILVYGNFTRVYFTLTQMKILEQWSES